MTTPLLHVLGGSHWQVPTVRLAKSMGCRVLVTDCYQKRPAYAIADHHEVVDITDIGATLAVAERYRIQGILCDTTDVGVPAAAYVAEQLGLPGMGYEVARNFTNKGRMRRLTEAAGLTVPAYHLLRSTADLEQVARRLGTPALVKPVDNQSGKGVSLVSDSANLAHAFDHALARSRDGTVLIEAMIQGQEIIVDGFMLDGNVQILGIARKTPYPHQPIVASRITYGSAFPVSALARIKDVNRRTLAALGLASGIFHGEYMLAGDEVVPIDIAARGGGCMIYSHVLPYISGMDVNGAMIKLALGLRPVAGPTQTGAASIEFFGMPRGEIESIEGEATASSLPGILGVHFNIGIGGLVGPLAKKDDRPGFIVAGGRTAADAIAASLAAKACLRVRMRGDGTSYPVI